MDQVQEPANIRYAKQILALVEKEIVENRSNISSVEVKHRQLLEDQKRLREEQKSLLRELSKLESEECSAPNNIPIKRLIMNNEEMRYE